MDIIMTFLSTSAQTTDDVIASWDHNMDDFVALLSTSDLSSLFEKPIKDDGLSQGNSSSSPPRWTLLNTALILSIVAVLSVAMLAFSRWYYTNRNRFYKRQYDEGPQHHSNSSFTSSTPHKSDRLEDTSSNPEDDMLREVLDQRSTFSCWKHWDTLNGVVSEESDGGWNSGSGSGSVPDSYLHDSKNKSISNLLDPYTRDDVWSVAPDHPLCLSSNSSIQSDGAVNTEDGLNDFVVPRRIHSADSIIVIDATSRPQADASTACSFETNHFWIPGKFH